MLLPNPVLENSVNPSAARIFASSPSGFRQTVLDCVLASKRVEGEFDRFVDACTLTSWYEWSVLQYWSSISPLLAHCCFNIFVVESLNFASINWFVFGEELSNLHRVSTSLMFSFDESCTWWFYWLRYNQYCYSIGVQVSSIGSILLPYCKAIFCFVWVKSA